MSKMTQKQHEQQNAANKKDADSQDGQTEDCDGAVLRKLNRGKDSVKSKHTNDKTPTNKDNAGAALNELNDDANRSN